jgi:cytochrome P450
LNNHNLFTLLYFRLVKANIDPSLPASQRISDEEVMYQINTFLFAGSDTTSLALTWTFQLLAQNLSVQDRLREELLAISANTPDEPGASFSQEIDALPYLDKVCRESLRLIPPVHSSIRAASKDDVLPATDKPEGIKIAKGQFIHVAIEGFNLDKDAWGEDAHEFKYVIGQTY